jgi:PilX N-terminal
VIEAHPHYVSNPRRQTQHGVALVTTMVILAVMAIVAVALMQGVTTDRASARSGANYYRAVLAADAGLAVASSTLAGLVVRYPDSVTVWQNIGGGAVNGTNNEATVLYLRAQSANTNLGARPGQFGGDVTLLAQPLVSRAGATPDSINTNLLPLSDVVSSVPFTLGSSTTVNINATDAARSDPFVGSRSSTNPGAPVAAAQWIYMTRHGGVYDPATNPYVARYAFWVEDESFKVNVNVATNGARDTTSLGTNANEIRLDGSWMSSSNTSISKANFTNAILARGANGYPTVSTAALGAEISGSNASPEVRFLTTIRSAGLDLSRGGFKRFNINTVTNGDKRTALDRIVAAITNSNSSPLFGQRFYRSGANAASTANTNVTAQDAEIYVQKIAANIFDYIDSDNQPTIINDENNFPLKTNSLGIGPKGNLPGPNLEGPNSAAAVGIENLPRLQEYAVHARIIKLQHDSADANSFGFNSANASLNPKPTAANFEIWIDHYFEFWNPGTRDIVLTNAFMSIVDQPAFAGVTGALALERDIVNIPIESITFPAGGLVVMTTAAAGEESISALATSALLTPANLSNAVFVNLPVADADRKFVGSTTSISNLTTPYNSFDRLFFAGVPSAASAGIVIANNQGLLDSFYGLTWSPITSGWPLLVSNNTIKSSLSIDNIHGGDAVLLRASSLRGNRTNNGILPPGPNVAEGDPRTLNEQLQFQYSAISSEDQRTSFYMTLVNDTPGQPKSPNFGLPNTYYTASAIVSNQLLATTWMDTSGLGSGSSSAPLFVRNGALRSIGELGHITDPARTRGGGGLAERLVRGGGRTLRIGQPEVGLNSYPGNATVWWYAGSQTNVSRTWTSWRLADIFTTTTTGANGAAAAANPGVWRTTNSFTIPGLINPNGALRDNGAALKAALFGFVGEPSPSAVGGGTEQGATGTAAASFNVTSVVANVIGRLNTVAGTGLPTGSLNPFWERGEISELRLLNTGTALGLNISNVFDRGREELVRRTIEMITTRGSIFSAYIVGQSLQVVGTTTNILSTSRLRSTFEIIPQFANPTTSTNDNFTIPEVSERFAAPTNYSIRSISRFYD